MIFKQWVLSCLLVVAVWSFFSRCLNFSASYMKNVNILRSKTDKITK